MASLPSVTSDFTLPHTDTGGTAGIGSALGSRYDIISTLFFLRQRGGKRVV